MSSGEEGDLRGDQGRGGRVCRGWSSLLLGHWAAGGDEGQDSEEAGMRSEASAQRVPW